MKGIELTPERPVARLAELGARAEAADFDTVFASHHYNNRDPLLALAAVAEATDLRVATGVANPYETHPVTLASRVATLDELSDGRAVFGVGAGDRSTLANLGVDRDRPLRRVLETFTVARRLWAGERVDHEGTFTARDAGLNYAPPGDIPVYVGAQGPHMIRMAAKHADGVLYNGSHPRDFEWATEQVAAGLDERPESRGPFDFAAYASVSVADEPEAALTAARPPAAFIAAGAAPPVLERHDLDPDRAERIGAAISEGAFREAFDLVSDEMLAAFCIAGTPEEVEARMAAVLEYADSFVAGSPLGPDPEAAIDLAGAALRGTGARL